MKTMKKKKIYVHPKIEAISVESMAMCVSSSEKIRMRSSSLTNEEDENPGTSTTGLINESYEWK